MMLSAMLNKYKKMGGQPLFVNDVRELVRAYEREGWPMPQYLKFCDDALHKGYSVSLYNAQRTASKYVTVRHKRKTFVVRFSNHRPNKDRELNGDCDFFVGVTNTGVRRTSDAWQAMLDYFKSRS
jgi:hypothetical protein